jgi:hypothetical protein
MHCTSTMVVSAPGAGSIGHTKCRLILGALIFFAMTLIKAIESTTRSRGASVVTESRHSPDVVLTFTIQFAGTSVGTRFGRSDCNEKYSFVLR